MSDLSLEAHALRITELAGREAMRHFRNPLDVSFKSDESPVTHADRAVESAVRDYLAEHFPDHGLFGEEQGIKGNLTGPLWVIDPIDGTRSFLSGHPLFGFLLAHLVDDDLRLGVVGMPALGETYIGMIGQGANCNGTPIHTSGQTKLDQAVLFVNEAEHLLNREPDVINALRQAGQTRRFSYDCYPHALLAAGHVDAVVDYNLQPYDYLAVSALVEAAGGVVTDWGGRVVTLHSNGCLLAAATPELHDELLSLVSEAYAG